jgi:hypothetical protein
MLAAAIAFTASAAASSSAPVSGKMSTRAIA